MKRLEGITGPAKKKCYASLGWKLITSDEGDVACLSQLLQLPWSYRKLAKIPGLTIVKNSKIKHRKSMKLCSKTPLRSESASRTIKWLTIYIYEATENWHDGGHWSARSSNPSIFLIVPWGWIFYFPSRSIIKGDANSYPLTSIVAKVTQDQMMEGLIENIRSYDFTQNFGL